MTLTESFLFVWLGVVNAFVIWLSFERDYLLERIKKLEAEHD